MLFLCILFWRHRNRKFSRSHKADTRTFSCFSMIPAVWLFEPSEAAVERGDVTGHVMQPLHLQYINRQAESQRWSPALLSWSTFAQKWVDWVGLKLAKTTPPCTSPLLHSSTHFGHNMAEAAGENYFVLSTEKDKAPPLKIGFSRKNRQRNVLKMF